MLWHIQDFYCEWKKVLATKTNTFVSEQIVRRPILEKSARDLKATLSPPLSYWMIWSTHSCTAQQDKQPSLRICVLSQHAVLRSESPTGKCAKFHTMQQATIEIIRQDCFLLLVRATYWLTSRSWWIAQIRLRRPRAVVLKLSWAVDPFKRLRRILNISWHGLCNITAKLPVVKASACGPQRTAPWPPRGGRGPVWETLTWSFQQLYIWTYLGKTSKMKSTSEEVVRTI